MTRLNKSVLADLKAGETSVKLPEYDPEKLKAGIVHLGIGAFHRAHQAYFTEAVLNKFGGNWKIIGASLRSASVQEQMNPQQGLYSIVERGPDGEKVQLVAAVDNVLVGPQDPKQLIAAMASDDIKIVSLTVTEKGYCHDPATGNLNFSHPDIIHDLENPSAPKSAIAYLVAALQQRKDKNIKSFTALSCDNLPNNGKVLKKAVLQYAQKLDADLAEWIAANTSFPCTMIDSL
jgi:fructuronate reductase